MAKSTIYEVARRSGVSTATVSRVMHNAPGYSDETRRRVLAAARELSWVPNGAARGLAFRRAGIVGLLFPDLGASPDSDHDEPLFVDQVIRGAERAATLAGDAVLIAATHSTVGRDLAWSVASKVDGLVILAGSLPQKDIASIARSVPVVLLAMRATRRRLDSVGADNRGGARQVTTHLVEVHGHTELAFIGGPPRSADSNERFAGYRLAMADAGLPVPDAPDARGDFTDAGGARAVRELLDTRRHPPRAIVVGNDEMGIAALSVLRGLRLEVPSDVAVTGFDDISWAQHVRPALTTVRQPMREMGETAVRILLNRLNQPRSPLRTVTLATKVVIRRSCGCASQPAEAGRAGAA